MLSLNQKSEHLEFYLNQKNNNYADLIKEEIVFLFFDSAKYDLSFLKNLHTKADIEKRIDFIVSKSILHEHEDGIQQIIEEYLL